MTSKDAELHKLPSLKKQLPPIGQTTSIDDSLNSTGKPLAESIGNNAY